MKTRFLALAIAVMMVVAMLPVSVAAAGSTFEASIGAGKDYTDFEAAMAVFNAADYDEVILNVYGEVEMDLGIVFLTTKNVTINGFDNAVITLKDSRLTAPAGKEYSNPFNPDNQPTGFTIPNTAENASAADSSFTVNNVKVVSEKAPSNVLYSSGHSWRASYYTYFYAESVAFTNVDFVGGVSLDADAVFTNCTFSETDSLKFCIFADYEYSKVSEAYTVTLNDCTFSPESTAYGTLKIANKLGDADLNVDGCKFNGGPANAAIKTDKYVDTVISDTDFVNCEEYGWYSGKSGGTLNGMSVDENAFTEDNIQGVIEFLMGEGNSDGKPTPINFFMYFFMKMFLSEYELTVATEGNGAVVTEAEDLLVQFGNDIVLTPVAEEGAELLSVLVDGVEVELSDAYSFENVKEAHSITFIFSEIATEEVTEEEVVEEEIADEEIVEEEIVEDAE